MRSETQRARPSLYARLTEGVILPFYYGVTRNPALAEHRLLERSQWWSLPELEEHQAARIRAMLLHAWDHCPFYRQRFESLGAARGDLALPGALERIPPLQKRSVIESCDAFVDTSNPRPLLWTTTGGSTGETVRFCYDRDALGSMKARAMRFHRWAGWHEGERVARLWGSPMERRQAYTLKNRLVRRLKNTLFLDGYDLGRDTMASYARQLQAFRPQVIVAFTSCLHILTEYLEEQGVEGIRPRAIITTSSPLYPSYRERFERFYGCPVFDEYGSREFNQTAYECEHQGLHVSMEHIHVSVVRDGEAVPTGEAGELVVTGLFNRAFPFIRYAIGDLGRFVPEPCACGRALPLLEILKGRSSEMLMGPKGIPILGEFFIDLFDGLPGEVRKFRVYQTSATHLRIHLIAPAELKEESKRYVLGAIERKFGPEMEVEFVYVDEIGPLPSGKHLLTVNETSPAFARRP